MISESSPYYKYEFDFGWQGMYVDPTTGNNQTANRVYAPSTHHWLQPDPIYPNSGPNPYEAFNNSPTNFTDPSGLASIDNMPAYGRNTSNDNMAAFGGDWSNDNMPGFAGGVPALADNLQAFAGMFGGLQSIGRITDSPAANGNGVVLDFRPSDERQREIDKAQRAEAFRTLLRIVRAAIRSHVLGIIGGQGTLDDAAIQGLVEQGLAMVRYRNNRDGAFSEVLIPVPGEDGSCTVYRYKWVTPFWRFWEHWHWEFDKGIKGSLLSVLRGEAEADHRDAVVSDYNSRAATNVIAFYSLLPLNLIGSIAGAPIVIAGTTAADEAAVMAWLDAEEFARRVAELKQIVQALNEVGPPIGCQTVVALLTAEGKIIVAGGATDLRAAQIAVAAANGWQIAILPDVHAELTAILFAAENGLLPVAGALSLQMCGECELQILAWVGGGNFSFLLDASRLFFQFIFGGG